MSVWVFGALLIACVGLAPAFALEDLDKITIHEPRLENAVGVSVENHVNVYQQVQISADITNNQAESQTFVYIVQIKDGDGFVVSLGWITGNLEPTQKLNPSLPWVPDKSGEFAVEIFVWDDLKSNNPLAENPVIQVTVS